jgi:hypothetical protein
VQRNISHKALKYLIKKYRPAYQIGLYAGILQGVGRTAALSKRLLKPLLE